jgi:hypothetical protein
MRTLAALLALAFTFSHAARAQQKEPWLKAGDVVALVGGEDMVALAEEGWLETLVTWAQPGDRIRWRSLAWEGDTVFEQRRDLNYPTLEAQLDRMGATVVICQFGKMESFAGKEGVAAFTEAYGKLLARLSGEKKRRFVLMLPPRMMSFDERAQWWHQRHQDEMARDQQKGGGTIVSRDLRREAPHRPDLPLLERLPDFGVRRTQLTAYRDAIPAVAASCDALVVDPELPPSPDASVYLTRDGIHMVFERMKHDGVLAKALGGYEGGATKNDKTLAIHRAIETAILAKNRLWFHYTRPQNWAFLAGNRTNQPSSRDHRDPARRWFPEEMEQWVPLIEAKEKEIWALAAAPR